MLERRAHQARSQSHFRREPTTSRFSSRSRSSDTVRPHSAERVRQEHGADGLGTAMSQDARLGRDPQCEPAPNLNTCTLVRLCRGQAEENVEYNFTDSDAAPHFAKMAEAVLKQCTSTERFAPFLSTPPVPFMIMYAQLRCTRLEETDDIEYTPGEYTTFKINDERYVSNPHGKILTVNTPAKRPFTLILICTLGDEADGAPAVCFNYEKKGKQRVCKVSVGELFMGSFAEVETQYVDDKELINKFFMERNWPRPSHSQLAEEAEEGEDEDEEPSMKNHNGEFCIKKKDKWRALTSFEITKIVRILTVEESDEKYYILECQQTWSDDERPMLILAHDVKWNEAKDGRRYKELYRGVIKDVSVPMSTANDDALRRLFGEAFPVFVAHHLTLKVLLEWTKLLEGNDDCGPTQHVISYYGRQRDGVTVMSNCAFKEGLVYTHEESQTCVMTSLFQKGKGMLLPITCHPSMCLVQESHVRFVILLQFWNEMLPRHFTNNTIPAKAAICTAIMHLQCDKFWNDEGPAPGLPAAWMHSTEGSTGKSRCLQMINALLGFVDNSALMQGSTVTRASLFGRLSKQSCMSLTIDEFTTMSHRDHETSTKIKDATHLCFDGNERVVMATQNSLGSVKPRTSYIATSNVIPNQDDTPFMQRVLFIPFKAREAFGVGVDVGEINQEWSKMVQLFSCLLVDVDAFLVDGKLDNDALNDCTAFTNAIVDSNVQRHANMWGYLLYYMLLMWRVSYTSLDEFKLAELDETFEFVCTQVGAAHHDAEKTSSTIDMFLRAIHKIRTETATNPLTTENSCFHHHNFRTTLKPGYEQLTNNQWYTIKIEAAKSVIQNLTGAKFAVKDIVAAVKDRAGQGFLHDNNGYFYDIMKHPFPIKTTHFDDERGVSCDVALPEDQLQSATLTRARCIWVRKDVYDRIVSDDMMSTADFKGVEITTRNHTFNFYKAVQTDAWKGWEALRNSHFNVFCGLKNALLIPSKPSELTRGDFLEEIFDTAPDAAEYFTLDKYLASYDHTPGVDRRIPFAYLHNPFKYRNEFEDDFMENTLASRMPSDEMDESDDPPAATPLSTGSTPLAGSRCSSELGGDMTESKKRSRHYEEESINSADEEEEARWNTLLYPTHTYTTPLLV